MTESKGVKPTMPEQPHKPAPKIVAARPPPADYQADPVDPFPIPTPAPRRARKSAGKSMAGAGAVAAAVAPVGGPVEPTPAPQAPVNRATRLSHSRDHKSIRIAHLYPSLLNVVGAGGNLIAIQRRAQWRGIPVDIVAVEKGEAPDFRKFDIVLFHGGQDVEMAVAAEDFT